MKKVSNSFFNDYQDMLIKNDKLSEENRKLSYLNNLLNMRINTLEKNEDKNNEIIKAFEEKLKEQENEIARLKSQLNADGTTHGIPTSQTPINKKKIIPNSREKSNCKIGGQVGHKKNKLEKFDDSEITEIVEHKVECCPHCHSTSIEKTEKVNEKDELDYKIVVIKRRHKFNEYKCTECGKEFHAPIANTLKEENQYGPNVKTLGLTLMNQANVTINKVQKIIYGMTNGEINLSEGYIAKLQKIQAKKLEQFENDVKNKLINESLLHWDDTVIMVNAKRSCMRYYGTDKVTLYKAHEHKNKEGLDEDGILKTLSSKTVVVHDHNKVNYNDDYIFRNAECNVHLIRDLKKVEENLNHKWAKKLSELIKKMDHKRKWLIKKGKEEFEQETINKFEDKFNDIVLEADKENKQDTGKYYADTESTLLLRILDYKSEYFLWIYDFDIPFDNNQSERGLRGIKSKQKASGQFWNIESAQNYAKIKTYIETCNKNNVNIYNALLMLSIGKPYSLENILNGEV